MKYGCIGKKLGHSFSKLIHNALGNNEYELLELAPEQVPSFMTRGDFKAINVTIPYKETVIPYLAKTDRGAELIGAVNTVVNRGGKLYGYNTDFSGMIALIHHANIEISGKKVLILGTGGTSKTARAVSRHLGAASVITVGRSGKEGSVTYEEAYESHTDAEIIINTTPVGMYPEIFDAPIDIKKFPRLSGVIDAVYNPLRTPLICEAKELGVAAEGGLYMLVAQGIIASEIFFDTKYPQKTYEDVYKKLLSDKENIVLVGMPASGKSTVGKIIAEKLKRSFIDTDELIIKSAGLPIPAIFAKHGEEYFRDLECQVIKEVSATGGAVIATGGGAILREENVKALCENGRIYFIDRPLELLIPTSDRPLSSSKEDVERRYRERYEIYCRICHRRIDGGLKASAVADDIIGDFLK